MSRKHANGLAGVRILKFFVPNPFWSVHFEESYVLDVPAQAQVELAGFPVLDEHDAPDASHYRTCNRIGAQVEPREDAPDSRENQETGIAVDKGKVESNLRC